MTPVKPELATLIGGLQAPTTLVGLAPAEWTRLLATARGVNLIGTLAERCGDAGLDLPPAVHRHFDGARQLAERQRLSVHWEVAQLAETLAPLELPVLLLKGAAYVMGGRRLGRGRMFGDIDILVPREALGAVESQLMLAGWISAKTDAYDQRYYREWMHELPPMTHIRRGTVLDVHHTILPLTARHAPDAASTIARAEPLPAWAPMCVPCPEDLLVHSITHLMHEGELHNGIRDLHDVDEMARIFGAEADFWDRLVTRAVGNDLAAPVAFGLALAKQMFDAPIPAQVIQRLHREPLPRWLWPLYRSALDPAPGATGMLAGFAIYVRAHALRMPMPLLLRHLAIKAWRGMPPEQAPRPRPHP